MNPLISNDLRTSLTEILSVVSEIESSSVFDSNKDLTINNLSLKAFSNTLIYSSENIAGKIYSILNIFLKKINYASESYDLERSLKFILNELFDKAVLFAYEKRCDRIKGALCEVRNVYIIAKGNEQKDVNCLHEENYKRYLKEEISNLADDNINNLSQKFLKKEPLAINEARTIRNTINAFKDATYSFWDWFLIHYHQSQNQRHNLFYLFSPYIKIESLITNHFYFKALEREASWVWLEGKLQMKIPIACLVKLGNPENLNLADKEQLEQWITVINLNYQSIPSKIFKEVLLDIIKITEIENLYSLSMLQIVSWLRSQNCLLLNETDSFQLEWRGLLDKQKYVICNGVNLELGNELKDYDPTFTYKYYEIIGHPKWILEVPDNLFALIDRAKIDEYNQPPLRVAKVIRNINPNYPTNIQSGLDKEGRCVVVEKLDLLKDYQWTSQNAEIDPNDKEILQPICNHLNFILKKGEFQYDLSLENLGRNHKGKIRYVHQKSCSKQPFNYSSLESKCVELSKGNVFVLNYLINVSQFNTCPVAVFYRQQILEVFNTGRNDVITSFITQPFSKQERFDCANNLRQQSLELMQNCIQQLKRKLNISHRTQLTILQAIVSRRLIYFFSHSILSQSLPINLFQQVVESLNHIEDLNKDINLQQPMHLAYQQYYLSENLEIRQKNIQVAKLKELKQSKKS